MTAANCPCNASAALLDLLAQADAAVAACVSPTTWQAIGTEDAGRWIREAVERHNVRKGSVNAGR